VKLGFGASAGAAIAVVDVPSANAPSATRQCFIEIPPEELSCNKAELPEVTRALLTHGEPRCSC
jgi:hypothetical protein